MCAIYDDQTFYEQYAQMPRSVMGLQAAGEWHQLKALFPDMSGKRVLDLGCGYGWHCEYAIAQGAYEVLGIDQSERMIEEARQHHCADTITYRVCDVIAYEYPKDTFDVVISNLMLHYIEDLDDIYRKVYQTLKTNGTFLFNIEHPVFTSGVGQDWIYNEDGTPQYWPVDDYFVTGKRSTHFLGADVMKQHHTLTQILNGLLRCGFQLQAVEEAQPSEDMRANKDMKHEFRRPMMLLVKAIKRE